ncbi:hypothetical protein MMC13_003374 [Lambiella insularis]|nr:hypothetical protein [Lambiella insularis]
MSSSMRARNAITAAIGASAWLSGGMASISLLAVPALSSAPSNTALCQQFTTLYNIGRRTQPPVTLLTSLIFYYAAYCNRSRLMAAAGTSVLAVLPYTIIVLEPTSNAIKDKIHYHDIERNDGQEEIALVKRWGVLNSISATFPAVAAWLGALALLQGA